MTKDIRKALVFDNFQQAWEFWRRTPKCKPWRSDGHPNRPLTASHWEFVPVPEK
jgi:hypothetical protein